jgi:penicillin amidase/acyl-homoserine-lactone acylase
MPRVPARPRTLLVSAAAACAAFAAWVFWPAVPERLEHLRSAGDGYDVRILRDTWGVPHVFGGTDPDVAYGLAYAHAEDDFETIQGALLAARGRLASVFGRSAAPNDYMVQLLRVWDFVDVRYERDLAPDTRALCDAYAAGLNVYAARHPDRTLPGLFPVRGKDVVAGFVHKLPLFFGLQQTLEELLAPESDRAPSGPPPSGSNTFAVGPARSADGATRLLVNSHQPWDGPVAWYEVHLRSDAGWDAAGGVFPGAPVVLHGHNRDLGWAHTVNRPDLIDVYALDVNPKDPNQYRLDGAWRELEVRSAAIEVKLAGRLSWTVRREVLWSVFGPAVRAPRGTFAIRFANMGDVRAVEQWYRMNRARSRDEWLDALRMGAVPSLNCGYADGRGHIGYVYNARLPIRSGAIDWSGDVRGDSSTTLWTEYMPFDRLPQVWDPQSGFVQSCNSSPFRTTSGPGNPDASAYPPSLGIETRMTNRALRALELLDGDGPITAEAFEAFKFDTAYSKASNTARRLARLLAAPLPDDPLAREAEARLRSWDLRADASNTSAALALLALRPDDADTDVGSSLEDDQRRLLEAARGLKRRFGRLDVPWSEVNRLRRGPVDLGLDGAPDVLRAVYGRPATDGRLVGVAGDSYVMIVEWDREGRVRSRSIHQYGSATRDASSPHYADQAPLFARGALKPVWLDDAEIRRHLEREYRPGAE